ncbi:SusC/RagA family TonB-linked outer membrane protein [Flavihumibacter profundi]|uniref:SusC/RagA family TonB-linked outer membrane protein n=1 Tax=Flavihumibacter profundi TaxID=2716883 RepID=UPI001CC6572F|nr:SusC/RagA family TonB-linked outer membrane protein [Flavihumibacter profundi]MBZ5855923.1 SusC/RagA family TonB-linked outer membrane protein [Flavihumibacter profundi]
MRKLILFAAWLLCILFLPGRLFAQDRTITGKITDQNAIPLANVSVFIAKTNIGTITDGEGKFSLSVPPNTTLLVSSAGYKTQTIKVDNTVGDIQVKLLEDVSKLEEVVVTGLATSVKRRNLANSIATISSKELQGTAPAQTFDAALNGKIPGAYINANTGAPGGGLSVKLRGVTSIFGNTQPLYVVDGVFMDNTATSAGLNAVTGAATGGNSSTQDNPSSRIADLRSEDIENIEILKGASAAAIYGSKAAAGVIIITTKRGKQGKTRVSFSQDLGYSQVRKLLGTRPLSESIVQGQGWDVEEYKAAVAAGKIYNYEKEMYGNTGFTRNSVLSMTGGTDKTSFYFSAATKKEEGIIARTGYGNNSFRLNVDHRITNNIKIGISTNYINSSSDRGLTGNDNSGVTYGIALSSTPSFTELHPDVNGQYPRNKYAASNPIETRDKMTNNENVNRFVTGLNLDAILQKGGKSTTRFIARGGFDFYNLVTTALFPSSLQFQTVNKGTSIQGFTKNMNTNYILSLVNAYTPSDKLSLTTSAGITQETGDYNNLLNVATQVIAGQSNVDQAGALTASQFRTKVQDNGIFMQEEASIIDAITLTAGVRFDKSTNNGDPNQYYTYPKAGISWNLTKMDFWKGSFFENFKVRAAYGQAGNFPAYGSKFTSMPISNITGLPGSVVSTQQGEKNIKPETQTELEAGFDFSIFKGRLSMEFSYYNKNVYDFLMLNTLPSSSGFTNQWVNAGDLRNEGIEIGLNAQPVVTKKIRWNTTVNFWFNRSKVTKLTIPPVQLGSFGVALGTFQIEQGKSATQIIGLTDEPGYTVPIKVWGDQEPRFQMNSFNEITFNNRLSLRFLVHWKYKGDNINLTNLLNDLGGTSADFDSDNNKNGVPDGVDRIHKIGSTATEFIQNSGYLRFREIGMYYSFNRLPGKLVKALRLGVSLNNYITITNYAGYDPEVSNFGTGFSTGVDVDPFPASKHAAFHISVDF